MKKQTIIRLSCFLTLIFSVLVSLTIRTGTAQAQGANVVQNASFETAGTGGAADAANWTEGTNHTRASDKFHTGGWSLKSTFTGGGTSTNQTVSVTTNTTYTYSGWIWRQTTTGGSCMDMSDIAGEVQLCTGTTGSWQSLSGSWNSGSNTSVTLRLISDGTPNNSIWFDDISLASSTPPTFIPPTYTSTPGNGTPYGGTAPNMPGQVEAENYNVGGENVAYHDNDPANNGNSYRTDGVDIDGATEGGFEIGWTATGEWLKYTVNVPTAGTYNFNFRVASPNTGSSFHMEVDGTNVTGTMVVPNTGGWQAYTTLTKTGVSLSAGQHVLRWFEDAGGMNFNWFSVSVPNSGSSTAWQNGAFQVMVPNVVTQSNIVMAGAIPGVLDSMPLGNGRLGAAVWSANGFTAQLNRASDTYPGRKSPGWLVISGLTGLGGGTLNIYDAILTRSGGGMTASAYVLQGKDELIVDVTGANVNTTYTAQIQLWSGRSPTTSASGAFAVMSETWVDNGSGGSNQTFGTLAGITAGGQNVVASVINSTTIQVSFRPNADGTFRVVVASPGWSGGNAMTTTTGLIGSDASTATGTLRTNHLNWWHNFWANTGLIKITGQDGPYIQNIRDIELYSMALSSGGTFPGNQAGTLNIVSANRDGVTWAPADYWHWNLRMHVGAMIGAGHPELNTPYFNLYKNNMGNIQAWTQGHIGGDGTNICVPETMRFNGNGYQGNDIGNPSCKSPGPNWNAMNQSTGAEVGMWVWQQYLHTKNQSHLSAHYPIMANSARYYLAKATVGGDGKRHMFPSNAHETQWNVHDPTSDVAAMKALFPATIQAAQILGVDATLVSQLQAAIPQIIDYPRTDWQTKSQVLNASNDASGNTMVAYSMDPTAQIRNSENVGLDLLYPFNLVGLNSASNMLSLLDRTYAHRSFINSNTWTYDSLHAARLGRASDFQANVKTTVQSRQTFIAGYTQFSSGDMTPYVETAGVVAASVQDALAQDFDGILRIAPAWPMSSWDVDGTVFIQNNSKVHIQVKGGQLTTVVYVSGFSGNKAVVNPWGTQNINVINAATGAVVVSPTTASQISIPVQSGQAYIIQRVSNPLSSYPFAQVNATPASAKKTMGSVKLGN